MVFILFYVNIYNFSDCDCQAERQSALCELIPRRTCIVVGCTMKHIYIFRGSQFEIYIQLHY